MCDSFQSGSTIAKQGSNSSGWPDGIAWILGIGNALYAYGGTDAVIHISEEITHPGKRLPQVMLVVSMPTLWARLIFPGIRQCSLVLSRQFL